MNTFNCNHEPNQSFTSMLEAHAQRLLDDNNVELKFPIAVRRLKREDIRETPCATREDLRDLDCFTIDCDDTKDMDDAVSLIETGSGYQLGVHIADVAGYIQPHSALDCEAMQRGTSIYLPHMTIPMFPEMISNDICSLNPNVDRNTISVLIDLDACGNVLDSRITKAVIRSGIKGVYSEINSILAGKAAPSVRSKYACFTPTLFAMDALSRKLRSIRAANGANVENRQRANVRLIDDTVDLVPCKHGASERIIEEFMVLANRIVGEYFLAHALPTIFRAHEGAGKLAKYTTSADGHYDLQIDHYAHFTSPIRRLSDCRVHQVLTAHLAGCNNDCLHYLFDALLDESCEYANKRSRRANQIQKSCEALCYEHYFNRRQFDAFSGVVTCYDHFGQPWIRLDDFDIDVIGSTAPVLKVGQRVTLNVHAHDRKLYSRGVVAA